MIYISNSGNQLNIQNYVKTWIRGNADINFSRVQNTRGFPRIFVNLSQPETGSQRLCLRAAKQSIILIMEP